MSVLLANATLGVRRRIESGQDAYGEPVPAGWGPIVGLEPGRTNERSDGGWSLGVDPSLWPIRQGDLVVKTTGESWLVNTADLIQNNYDHYVDWVRVDGAQRSSGGTEPGGAWFVARYEETVTPEQPVGPPRYIAPHVWAGSGPPPTEPFGAAVGDEYVDLLSGTVYRLDA